MDSNFGISQLDFQKPQQSLITEASSNSVCSTEMEYKDTAVKCKSFLVKSSLSVLPEQDEEQFETNQCSQ